MYWAIAAIIVGVVAVAVVLWRRAALVTPKFKSLEDRMAWLARRAVRAARADKVKLDWLPGSIAQVEEVLGRLHEQYRTDGDEDELQERALEFGAYVGETIRRAAPGAYWTEDHSVAGPQSFPLHLPGGDSFPVGWCYRRLKNGPDENVWIKYQMLLHQREATTHGPR